MRLIALSLASLLLAHVATAEGPKSFARHFEVPVRSPDHTATASASRTTFDASLLRRIEPGGTASALALGARAESFPSPSFRHSTGVAQFAIRAVPGDLQSPIQLMAAFGLRRFSFRVSSWRRLGSGPSVHASALSVVRSVNLSQTGANTALGLSVTMYRLGSRFDPVYSRRPVSFQLLFRIRFGSGRSGRISPSGLSKSL